MQQFKIKKKKKSLQGRIYFLTQTKYQGLEPGLRLNWNKKSELFVKTLSRFDVIVKQDSAALKTVKYCVLWYQIENDTGCVIMLFDHVDSFHLSL